MSKDSTRTMPLMGHLGELRKRITYSAIVIVVFVIAAFIEKDYVLAILMRPLRQAGFTEDLATFGVTEAFMQILKVSIYAGLVIALPFLLYQFWAFIMPALYENEKRSVVPYVLFTTALFLAGIAFAYFVVLPVGLRFLVGYGDQFFNQLFQAERYFSFISMFLLAFGVVFELPLIMMLLAWAGIIDYIRMRKWRKYAILIDGGHRHGPHPQPGPGQHGPHAHPLDHPLRVRHLAWPSWRPSGSSSGRRQAALAEAEEATPVEAGTTGG